MSQLSLAKDNVVKMEGHVQGSLCETSECKLEEECSIAWGLQHGRWFPVHPGDSGMAEKIPGQV